MNSIQPTLANHVNHLCKQ